MDPNFKPTEEQQAVYEAVRGRESLMVKAYAGTAKTTTLEFVAPQVRVPAMALAFNFSIKQELAKRMPKHFKVMTMNGLGHMTLARMLNDIRLDAPDGRKLGKILSLEAKDRKMALDGDQWRNARLLTEKVQQLGVVPGEFGFEGLVEDTWHTWKTVADDLWMSPEEFDYVYELCHWALVEGIRRIRNGSISFDDQIYYPTLFGGNFVQYPMLMVDEAQDLSPLQHRMLAKVTRPDGRVTAVGDPKQAIYAFRGADSRSMDKIEQLRPEWKQLTLQTSFRCPELVTERQKQHAPGFKSKSPFKGKFAKLRTGAANGWTWGQLLAQLPDENSSVAILCRNNGPLLATAFRLIKEGIAPYMLGRDIGLNLVSLSKKICRDESESIDNFIGELERWKAKELQSENGEATYKADSIRDRAECLKVVALAGCRNVGELRIRLENLFRRQDGRVVLSTIHRSKGLEWDVVVHLDPWRVPSKQAVKALRDGDPGPMEQERNLLYVCETRTKNVLVHADSEGFEGVEREGVEEEVVDGEFSEVEMLEGPK